MKELPYESFSSCAKPLLDLPGIQKRTDFLFDAMILHGTPVIVSDFIISYSTIKSLNYDNKGFHFVDQYGEGCELRETEKSKIQYVIGVLQGELLQRLSDTTHIQWVPHYRIYIEPESGQSQLLLVFRMRESGQLVDETREAVNNFV